MEEEEEEDEQEEEDEEEDDCGWQVLVLLPCRNSAWRFIKKLLELAPSAQRPKGRIDNLQVKTRQGRACSDC